MASNPGCRNHNFLQFNESTGVFLLMVEFENVLMGKNMDKNVYDATPEEREASTYGYF